MSTPFTFSLSTITKQVPVQWHGTPLGIRIKTVTQNFDNGHWYILIGKRWWSLSHELNVNGGYSINVGQPDGWQPTWPDDEEGYTRDDN